MKKLFLAYMGASSQERLMEDHEIILVGAYDLDEAKKIAIEKTKLTEGVHIDMILEINNVDGYNVILEKGGEENIEKVSDYSEV